MEEEAFEEKDIEGTVNPSRTRPSIIIELTEIEAAYIGLHWPEPDPLHVYHIIEFSTCIGLLNV